jgi:hypothetical protein
MVKLIQNSFNEFQLLGSLMHSLGVDLTLCQWMAIVAVSLIPLTWLGTPKDFWSVKIENHLAF